MHPLCVELETVPDGHAVQPVAPIGAKKPSEHGEHTASPGDGA
jgi:hypothetical protein